MLSRLLIFLVIINVFPRVHLTSEEQQACEKSTAEINRSEQIESIRKYILEQLGYPEAPNSSSEIIPEDKLTDYYVQKERVANGHEECDTKRFYAVNVSTIPGKPLFTNGNTSGSGSEGGS